MMYTVPIALIGWPILMLIVFGLMPASRAVCVALIGGWLFLPVAGYEIASLPDYDKTAATSLSALLGVLIYDPIRLGSFKPSLWDFPMAIWCLSPIATSMENGLGVYDGLSYSLAVVIAWGIPYFLGRVYFSSPNGVRAILIAIVIGGLIYVPLCVFEMRMSPQLHNWVYGYHASPFHMTQRLGGYRPTVFMQHGLMVGLWMTISTLACMALLFANSRMRISGFRIAWLLIVTLGTTLLCRSLGALALLGVASCVMLALKYFHKQHVLAIFVCIPIVYIGLGVSGTKEQFDERFLTVAHSVSPDRAKSLEGRLFHEQQLVIRANERPLLGWGRWGRNRVRNDYGDDTSVTDAFWVITLGQRGTLGVAAIYLVMLLPPLVFGFSKAMKPRGREQYELVGLSMIVVVYAADGLFNAMPLPIIHLASGSLAGTMVWIRGMLDGKSRLTPALPATPSGTSDA